MKIINIKLERVLKFSESEKFSILYVSARAKVHKFN